MPNIQKQKGDIAEKNFRIWLNKHKIAYFFVEQGINTLSIALKELFESKRPDFIILIPKIGLVVVDVKHATFRKNSFFIKVDDLKKYINLEQNFNLKIWFAVSNDKLNYKNWYWISPSRALMKGKPTKRPSGGKFFRGYDISIEDCLKITTSEAMDEYIMELNKY